MPQQTNIKPRAFISHAARESKPVVRQLEKKLRADDAKVWVDHLVVRVMTLFARTVSIHFSVFVSLKNFTHHLFACIFQNSLAYNGPHLRVRVWLLRLILLRRQIKFWRCCHVHVHLRSWFRPYNCPLLLFK